VADVLINGNSHLSHAPCLGCEGMCDSGSEVLCCKIEKQGNKCPYKILLSKSGDNVVGIDPGLAEKIVEEVLRKNIFSDLKSDNFRGQVKYEKSRFDFAGIDTNSVPFALEVKNVPLTENNISYFSKNTKKKQKTVSERAVKHLKELGDLANLNQRAIICFVIQRDDSVAFSPAFEDAIYKDAFVKALEKGVEVICLVVKWDILGNVYFIRDDLPILI
tara:strand:- start:56 stop:709 length:654 start_codon:yes stop_codon:yes gene_type:complete